MSDPAPAPTTGVTTDITLPTFAEQLEGSLKSDEKVSQWLSNWKDKNISDFVKDNYTLGETHKTLQGDLEGRVKIPGENTTEEELNAYRQAIGVPEKPDGYEIKKADLPEGMSYDEVLENNFRGVAHKLNLTPAQVRGLYEMYETYNIDIHNQIVKSINDNREKSVNTLKNIWKGDTYEANRTKATRTFFETLKKLNPPAELGGMESIKKEFDESGFGDNPAMVWYFNKLYDLIGSDSFIQVHPSGGSTEGEEKSLKFPSMETK